MNQSVRHLDSVLSRITYTDTGVVVETRCTLTVVTDIRDTPVGPVNFGYVLRGPQRRVVLNEALE